MNRRLDQVLRPLESAAFLAAFIAYWLPFAAANQCCFYQPVTGLSFFLTTLVFVLHSPDSVAYFAMLGLPLLAALAGMFYRRSAAPRGLLVGLAFALVGFLGLTSAWVWLGGSGWGYGFYAAAGAFLVAGAIGGLRLIRALLAGHIPAEPIVDEPAESASQAILRRARGDW